MALLDFWMPTYDVAARYAIRIGASPARVYASLLATDFSRPWLVRGLMGVRLLPALLRSPGPTWRHKERSPLPSPLALSAMLTVPSGSGAILSVLVRAWLLR